MRFTVNIPKDKIAHFLAGLAIAAITAAAWFLVSQLGLVEMRPAWLAVLIAAGVAGVVKEKADADDNKVHPGMHGVEALDALATSLGAAPVALLIATQAP